MSDRDAIVEEYHERAAIMEHDGGMRRERAERQTWARLLEKHGAATMREVRDHMTYGALRARGGR